jgi:hypothetical protein
LPAFEKLAMITAKVGTPNRPNKTKLKITQHAFTEFMGARFGITALEAKRFVDTFKTMIYDHLGLGNTFTVADTEPPRVLAMLGAIGEQLGKNAAALRQLRDSLNPFSRFDVGLLSGLHHAMKWQAKESRPHETV